MNIGFEKIIPTPQYPQGIQATHLAGLDWSSKANVVVQFKAAIKQDLRTAQNGRCSYCRRLLFDDIATHIEHFVEKSQYNEYAFEIQNLSLSCGTCNTQKNGYNNTFNSWLKKRAKRAGRDLQSRCPTLLYEPAAGSALPSTSQDYRWVHPHLDNYSQNIRIERGWVFVGSTLKGTRTIRSVKLNALAKIEQRALSERLATRGGMLSTLVGAMAELNRHKAREVAATVVKVLQRRRNLMRSGAA